MKKTILLAMVLLSNAICFSQSFNYQAVVRDASNNPIANQAIGVQLKILDGSATGSTLYTETHTVTSNINGVIAISVGEGTTMDVFSTINWSTQNQWLDLSVDITGGTTYSPLGTTKLVQVPYALHATEAGNLTTPYTAGSGIELTNNVISATAQGWLRTNGTLPTTIEQEIYRTGNIGIGASASNPSFPLDVRGTGGERLRAYSEDSFFAGVIAKNNTREFFMGVQATFETNNTTSGFHIYDNTVGAQRMVIDEDGNVGVNEANPDDKLHITTGENGTRVRLENSSNGWAGMVAKNTQRELFIGIQGAFDANPGEFHIYDNTAGARRMVIDANGEVGIGRDNPSVRLDVNGSVNCTGGTCSSDMRWKRNITTLDNTLDNILKLRGVSYYWRTQEFPDRDFENDKQIGVIAQEVEKIYPELIHTDNDGYKSMDYMSLSAVLLEATKQQQLLIEQQQKELELLKQKLDKVDALEAKLDKILSE